MLLSTTVGEWFKDIFGVLLVRKACSCQFKIYRCPIMDAVFQVTVLAKFEINR